MLGTTRQHGLDSVQGNSQADQMNARLEAAPFSAVTAGYKMERCCFCQASGGAGGRSLALPGCVRTAPRRIYFFPSACCNKPARTELILQQNKAEHCLLFSGRFLLKNTHSALMGVGEQATWPQLGRDHPTCLATASPSTAIPPGAAPCMLLLTSLSAGAAPQLSPHLCA